MTSNAEPIMDGITMASKVEVPFDIDDPTHDPIFSMERWELNNASIAGTKGAGCAPEPTSKTAQETPGSATQGKAAAAALESTAGGGQQGAASGEMQNDESDGYLR